MSSRKRRESRQDIIGLLFEINFNTDYQPETILSNAREYRPLPEDPYVDKCFLGICSHLDEIDKLISDNSKSWSIDRISKIVLSIMRLAVYEMVFSDEKLGARIAINEAVELTKMYFDSESAAFANGILNAIAKSCGCEA